MRSLSATLLANQKSPNCFERPQLAKLVLTKAGQSTQTYDISSTTNRIRGISHVEQEFSQLASVSVNSDSTLAALTLEGYLGTISWGYNDDTQGDEYSACAPLEVVGKKTPTLFTGPQTQLITNFALAGVFDLMEADKASERLTLEPSDRRTIKTLMTAVANATLVPFDHCKNYTITFDSEDSLIDSYIPADYFYVGFNESRLSVLKKLIKTTKCKMIIKADGAIHVFDPTISGDTYDAEYNDAVTNHNFFEKSTRTRLVIPTKFIVTSYPTHEVQYSGSATDSATETALGRSLPFHKYARLISDAQATAIATALLQHKQVGAEKGSGFAPMNCGKEIIDYVNITDSVASDTRAGNVGYILRQYTPGPGCTMEFRFGRLAQGLEFGALGALGDGNPTYDDLNALKEYMDEQIIILAEWILEQQEVIPRLWVTDELRIPVE